MTRDEMERKVLGFGQALVWFTERNKSLEDVILCDEAFLIYQNCVSAWEKLAENLGPDYEKHFKTEIFDVFVPQLQEVFDKMSIKNVYVGTIEYPFNRMIMFHMGAPDIEELHKMAAAIGIKREWFQNDPWHPHYDISKGKKALALQMGAMEVNDRELIRRCFPKHC